MPRDVAVAVAAPSERPRSSGRRALAIRAQLSTIAGRGTYAAPSAADPPRPLADASGRPAKAIVEVAHEIGRDLIVMGAHGHGRLHHALIGSTSDAVLRVNDRPVLLMRATGAAPATDPASTAPVAFGA